jgi:peptide deformylase
MASQPILLLGNLKLYEICQLALSDEIETVRNLSADLFDKIEVFRNNQGLGRAIAASHIGVMKRVVCTNVTDEITLIKPVYERMSEERMRVWDDCMSFSELIVKVECCE